MPGASSGNRPVWQRYAVKSDYRKYRKYLRNIDPGSCDHGCGNRDRNFMRLERRKNRGSPYAYFRPFSCVPGTCFCTGSSCCAGRGDPECDHRPGCDQLAEICKARQRTYPDTESFSVSDGSEAFRQQYRKTSDKTYFTQYCRTDSCDSSS